MSAEHQPSNVRDRDKTQRQEMGQVLERESSHVQDSEYRDTLIKLGVQRKE